MLTIDLNFPDPVTREADFFGREELWDQIARDLLAPNTRPVILLGECQHGKTSLLNMIIHRIGGLQDRPLTPVRLPPGSELQSHQDLAAALVDCLSRAAHASPDNSPGPSEAQPQPPANTEALLQALVDQVQAGAGGKYIFCLDDFDSLIQPLVHGGRQDEVQKIIDLVDTLIHRRGPLGINFILTLSKIPEILENPYAANRILAASRLLELPPFTLAETREMVQALLASEGPLPEQALRRIEHYTGGNPYLVKLFLDTCFHASGNLAEIANLTRSAIDGLNQQAATNLGNSLVFQNIFERYFSIQERALALLMARLDRPVNLIELSLLGAQFITAANSLARRGYLHKGAQDFSWRIHFFPTWLRHWERYHEEMDRLSVTRLVDTVSIDIWIEKSTKKVYFQQTPLTLSNREYEILECLCIYQGRLVTYDQIASHLWPVDEDWEDFSLGAITMAVSRLRKKINNTSRTPPFIETVPGKGYILYHAGFLAERMRI